ncbi:LysR substrate-binding domain-containing protein [Pantoea septica]|uniref:LysR substrate-binding domain-containing protein n=1 Tax=Pantoea septica TaxID=472695 RepID=UPI0039C99694
MPHLLTLQKNNPDLNLTLALDDRLSDLVSAGVDVALRLSSEPPDTLAARVLARIETPLFAAPHFARIIRWLSWPVCRTFASAVSYRRRRFG